MSKTKRLSSRILAVALLAGVIACSSSSTNTGGGSTKLADRCEPACAAAVQAGCSGTPTKNGCMLTCKALTSSPSCDPTGKAYFDCIDGKTFTCIADEAAVQECGQEYTDAIACAAAADPNPAIDVPCTDYCGKIIARGCLVTPTADDCKWNCAWAGATGIHCDQEWLTYLNCANADTLACFLGHAVSPGCANEFKAYSACINAQS
jgi:hypothetical protein